MFPLITRILKVLGVLSLQDYTKQKDTRGRYTILLVAILVRVNVHVSFKSM